MDGKASSCLPCTDMSIPVRQAALFLAPPVHRLLMPHWLTHLGALGLFSVAVVDSSFIPLPLPGSTDLLLLWLVANGGDPWLLAAIAIAGSLVGGYATWNLGRRGGEAALRRYVPARLLGRVVRMGGASPHPRRVSSRRASSADSAIAICACLRRAGRLARPLPERLRRGSNPALLPYCLDRRSLWTPRHPPVVRDAPEMVDSAALCVRGPARGRHLLWNLEGERPTQDRCC